MKLMSRSEYARKCGVTRQSIMRATNEGAVVLIKKNNKYMVDPEDNINKIYESDISEKSKAIVTHNKPLKNIEEAAESYLIEKARHKKSQRERTELQNAKYRGELLDVELVDIFVFLYLDKLHDNLKRLGNSFLDDTGMQIIKNGKVSNKTRDKWNTGISEIIFSTREELKKRIRKIQKQQQK